MHGSTDVAQPGYQALRVGRRSISGQHYLVTMVTSGRRRWFDDFDCARVTSSTLAQPSLWRESRLSCWVLMPDHFHALLELGGNESLGSLMRRVKAVSAREMNVHLGRWGSLWMPGYHDRALRSDEDVLRVARYVVANPLRSGLVKAIGDYPFWDAVWLGESAAPSSAIP